eukprot:CFRG0957T1
MPAMNVTEVSDLPVFHDITTTQTCLAKKLDALKLDVVNKPIEQKPAVKLAYIKRFMDESLIQKGSTCIVTKAQDISYNRSVALKKGTFAHLKQLRREYKIHKSLPHHPNVTTMYETVTNRTKRQICLIMELCDGGDLVDKLAAVDSGLGEETTIKYGSQIASGLAHIHAQGVAHRDIKSDNICSNSETGCMKIVDFGAAQRISEPISGLYVGTLGYMAPEIVTLLEKRIKVDEKTVVELDLLKADVWAFGITLYTMLTSRLPFSLASTSRPEYRRYLEGGVLGKEEDWNRISSDLQLLLLNVLAVEPSERWCAQQVSEYLKNQSFKIEL